MTNWLLDDLKELENKGLRRSLRTLSSPQAKECVLNGQKVLNFCSNNYLGLADDARLIKSAAEAMTKYGFGSGASRLVCGNTSLVEELEQAIASFKNTESSLVFNSGYGANTGIIPALVGRDDVVFSDKLNHASIVDGIILSRAEMKRYAHLDMSALEEGLKSSAHTKKLIVTDTVFSMDGDQAPIKNIVTLARRYGAMVMTDDAHGFGVLEQDFEGVEIQMGTLSKAAGCFGAYVCGSQTLKDYLINHARSFIYTTALPTSIIGAAITAVAIIKNEPERRKTLLDNADYLRGGLNKLGFDTLNSSTPIIPILVKDSVKAVEMSKRLLEQGIFVQAIRPPTVPVNTARLRVTVMATHTKDDLDKFLHAMKGL
jgi:8-amino-7-oxononanoate synthase